jgi:hypothetical protein
MVEYRDDGVGSSAQAFGKGRRRKMKFGAFLKEVKRGSEDVRALRSACARCPWRLTFASGLHVV